LTTPNNGNIYRKSGRQATTSPTFSTANISIRFTSVLRAGFYSRLLPTPPDSCTMNRSKN
jgi:hypothetical protein